MRLAVWSGPRNLSTALMYAFGNRADFAVVDEPFYAAYLSLTGLDHPMRDEIIMSQPVDPAEVIAGLTGVIPAGKPHVYHKHMSQHMIPDIPRDWFGGDMRHVMLIRHPARVVASFSAKYERPTLADIGFVQQAELFAELTAAGHDPVVIESTSIRANPETALRGLCERVGLAFDPAMLHWPAGGHRADGVWARHWYNAVHKSTGFAGAEPDLPTVAPEFAQLVEAAQPYYDMMAKHA